MDSDYHDKVLDPGMIGVTGGNTVRDFGTTKGLFNTMKVVH